MYERYNVQSENSSIEISKGKIAGEQRHFDIAFFQESSELLQSFKETKQGLVSDIFTYLVWIISAISFGCLVLIILRMRILSKKMTRQIIHFYETLEDILAYDARVDLSFKPSCAELNELQLTFNKIAKTINITTKTI